MNPLPFPVQFVWSPLTGYLTRLSHVCPLSTTFAASSRLLKYVTNRTFEGAPGTISTAFAPPRHRYIPPPSWRAKNRQSSPVVQSQRPDPWNVTPEALNHCAGEPGAVSPHLYSAVSVIRTIHFVLSSTEKRHIVLIVDSTAGCSVARPGAGLISSNLNRTFRRFGDVTSGI